MRTEELLNQAQAPLGAKSEYRTQYDPGLLCPIPRARAWDAVPFQGTDLWTAFELSWLNPKGLPQVAMAEFEIPWDSPAIIESKSFKLYLNSFNQTRLAGREALLECLTKDLSAAAGAPVRVRLYGLDEAPQQLNTLPGHSLDQQDVEIEHYHPTPELLRCVGDAPVEERLYSHLLKSNCPVTGQPDWASVAIAYKGAPICHAGLLKYLVSFREHGDFHEHCVEQIFMDIWTRCQPESLSVYARYVRRGGLDINPFRTSAAAPVPRLRLVRQ